MDKQEEAGPATEVEAVLEAVGGQDVRLSPEACDMMIDLSKTIRSWNEKVNLISRKDISRLVTYHFCDAVSLLPILRPEAAIEVLDVGGSNGLPGLVLAAASPFLRVTICDSRGNREGFLMEACAVLKGRAAYSIDRVDGDAFRRVNPGRFDLVVARAVTRLDLLLKWCLPLIRTGGVIAAYKGSRCMDEVKRAEGYLWAHGVRLVMVVGSPFASYCNPFRQFAIMATSG
jgi:16S rRNA (guanine527-N7)-methyltransferase